GRGDDGDAGQVGPSCTHDCRLANLGTEWTVCPDRVIEFVELQPGRAGMGQIIWSRGRRADAPPMPRGDLLLESPPEIPPPPGSKGFGKLLRILPMVAGAGAMALMMTGGMGGGTGRGVMGGLMGGMYAVSMLGMMLSQAGQGND